MVLVSVAFKQFDFSALYLLLLPALDEVIIVSYVPI